MSAAVQPMPSPFSPNSSQIAVAYSVCRSITRTAAKNFYYAFLVLPAAKRQALCAVYAFMRRCDDISDDVKMPAYERRQKLEAWIDAFHHSQSGHPTDDPVLLALTDTQRRYKIPVELLDQLAYGTGMDIPEDAGGAGKAARSLSKHSAICGSIAIALPRSWDWSASASSAIAMRRRNRWRKISDWPFNSPTSFAISRKTPAWDESICRRKTWPASRFTAEDFRQKAIPERLRWLLAAEADRAREYYGAAPDLMRLIDEDSRPALWVLVSIYSRLLDKIAQRKYNVFGDKIGLTVREKVFILGKGLLKRLA